MNPSKSLRASRNLPRFLLIVAFSIGLFLCGAVRAGETVYVRWVDDGDTIVLEDGRRIRYIGINAPEIGHAQIKPEPLGSQAKKFNRQMVLRKYVRLEFDQEKTDHYGRTLAYVFDAADTFVNREILLSGYGHCLYRHPNLKYQAVLMEAQQSAMKTATGIWHNWTQKEERYIGHKGSRRFHLDSCPLARSISTKNRAHFTNMWDALWQGYSPDKNCLPGGLFR